MFFNNILDKYKESVCDTEQEEQIEDQFYTQVANELEREYRDKGTQVKSIAVSRGNGVILESTYIQLRAKALQDEYYQKLMHENLKQEDKKKLLWDSRVKIFKHIKNELSDNGFKNRWYDAYNKFYKSNKVYIGELDTDAKLKLFENNENTAFKKKKPVLTLDIKPYLMEHYSKIDW